MPSEKKQSLAVLLLSGFIDYAGIALVYPLFAFMLFDPTQTFLPQGTSESVRGLWLGILLALLPLAQFFSCPIMGTLSDQKGRRPVLIFSLVIGVVAYLIGILGVLLSNLPLLALYRVLAGIAGGNASVLSAIVADVSRPEEKPKNYGLLNMCFGAGFTLGPFLGGYLSNFGTIVPFVVAIAFIALNLFLVVWRLKETLPSFRDVQVSFFEGVIQLKQAAKWPELRFVFLALLIFTFGWCFFTEFIPLFLIDRYAYSPREIGMYYGYTGFFYALSAGVFIQPVVQRIGVLGALVISQVLSGLYLFLFLFIFNASILWVYLPLSQFLLAFVYPTTAAVISNRVSDEFQGEALGIYQAVIAMALAICPLLMGSLVGEFPALAVLIGGGGMALAGILFLFFDYLPSRQKF